MTHGSVPDIGSEESAPAKSMLISALWKYTTEPAVKMGLLVLQFISSKISFPCQSFLLHYLLLAASHTSAAPRATEAYTTPCLPSVCPIQPTRTSTHAHHSHKTHQRKLVTMHHTTYRKDNNFLINTYRYTPWPCITCNKPNLSKNMPSIAHEKPCVPMQK